MGERFGPTRPQASARPPIGAYLPPRPRPSRPPSESSTFPHALRHRESSAPQHFDALVIGAGLSGLTAASLMAKRGLRVGVIDRNAHPGGSCGAFKRGDVLFDQGAAMLFGFGPRGFNPHRFVLNALEQPFDVIRHDSMCAMSFAGQRIEFTQDIDAFTDSLATLFPTERPAIKRFYADMLRLYDHVVAEAHLLTSLDEVDPWQMATGVRAHPVSHLRFLRLLNRSVSNLIGHYFKDPAIHRFFDKLCLAYCYATSAETPAVLGAIMFVDNHVGGTYYPAGSTLMLAGVLEKAIEEHGGTMLMRREVQRILFAGDRPCGVQCADGERLHAGHIVHGGTVWDLYQRLLPASKVKRRKRAQIDRLVPTPPNAVMYLHVRSDAIPQDAEAVEMLVDDTRALSESEITVYLPSLDDHALCPAGTHVLTVIGPCFDIADGLGATEHQRLKCRIARRFIAVLEQRFPHIGNAVLHCEVATPATVSRHAGKYRGAAAGPKQMMGQHLLKRQHIRTRWPGLYCCGESTVMGTGTPAVTLSGIAAANAVLASCGREPFRWQPDMPDFVREVPRRKGGRHLTQQVGQSDGPREALREDAPMAQEPQGETLRGHGLPLQKPPRERDPLQPREADASLEAQLVRAARHCQYCLHPSCCKVLALWNAPLPQGRPATGQPASPQPAGTTPRTPTNPQALRHQAAVVLRLDVPGIMRRIAVGNLVGARRLAASGLGLSLQPFDRQGEGGSFARAPLPAGNDVSPAPGKPSPFSGNTMPYAETDMPALLAAMERACIRAAKGEGSVSLSFVITTLLAEEMPMRAGRGKPDAPQFVTSPD